MGGDLHPRGMICVVQVDHCYLHILIKQFTQKLDVHVSGNITTPF